MIVPGDKVKDVISGFTGIVTARYWYINGCIRLEVTPQTLVKETGLPPDNLVFDEDQLIVVEKNWFGKQTSIKEEPKVKKAPGGPRGRTPVRR